MIANLRFLSYLIFSIIGGVILATYFPYDKSIMVNISYLLLTASLYELLTWKYQVDEETKGDET